MVHTVDIDLDGRKITLETGKIAKQANGAVVVRAGDSVVLVTAVFLVGLIKKMLLSCLILELKFIFFKFG